MITYLTYVDYLLVAKTEYYNDPKKGEEKRRCPVPKNQYAREMIKQSVINQIAFRYVLTDVWFASAESMIFIRHDVKKDFVMPVKTNRKIALSYDDRHHGRYVRTDKIDVFSASIAYTFYTNKPEMRGFAMQYAVITK